MSRIRRCLPGLATTALVGALVGAVVGGSTIAAASEAPSAVASIKPIHSLLAGVMNGAGTPSLLVRGGASPHTWSLRPSDAHALEHADFVVWVGDELESFLTGSIEALAGNAYVLELSRAKGITLLRTREGGVWDEHDHGGEADHREGNAHGHASGRGEDESEHGADRADAAASDHDEEHPASHDDEDRPPHVHREDGHQHGEGEYNLHLWLDPVNAAVIVEAMADALVRLDPVRTSVYRVNEAALKARLRALDDELKEAFAPVRDRGFVVFHDAWQYLDARYGLRAVGSVTVNPEQAPGAARVAEIREKITEAEATCVFAEPQFAPRLVQTLVDGTGAGTGTMDPLGAGLEDGPDLYFDLMRTNARMFRACFGL